MRPFLEQKSSTNFRPEVGFLIPRFALEQLFFGSPCRGTWDLSSLTGDGTLDPRIGSAEF